MISPCSSASPLDSLAQSLKRNVTMSPMFKTAGGVSDAFRLIPLLTEEGFAKATEDSKI